MNRHWNLPPGWTLAPLRDIATINPANPTRVPADDTPVSFVPMAAVEELSGRMNVATTRTWAEIKKGFTRFQEGDVVFAKITPSMENGKAALAASLFNGVGAGTTEFHVFRPQPGVAGRYLLHYLLQETFRRRARARMTGTAGQLRVPTQFLEEEVFPLAPTPEQNRIVDVVDSYLTRLDDAVATLQRVQATLKVYRASVLKAAMEGCLVLTEASLARAEKREYEPAEVLLSRILEERHIRWEEGKRAKLKRSGKAPSDGKWKAKKKEPISPITTSLPMLPEGWCWATVDQVANETMIGLVRNRQQQRKSPPGYAYLKMDAIGLNGSLRMDQFVYVDADKAVAGRYALQPNDILFNTRNSVELVGKTALVPGGASGRLFNNNIMRIRVCNGLAPAFIALQMSSLPFRARLEKIKRATTNVAAIYGKDLFPQVLAIPPAAEQERITEIVASLLSTQEAVNNTITSQLRRIARLRQSVLRWAFEGKCVDQDPSDEPAETLLARIRADRVVIASNMKRRGRKARGAA